MLTPEEKAVCDQLHLSEADYLAMRRPGVIQCLLDGSEDKPPAQPATDSGSEIRVGGFRCVR